MEEVMKSFECSSEMNELYKAMAKTQLELQPVVKSESVNMELKNGKKLRYDYATLGQAYDAIRQAAHKHGICFFQDIQTIENETYILTEIGHESGQFRRTRVNVNMPEYTDYSGKIRKPTFQELGSAITYLRRYAIVGSFSLSIQDDDGIEASKTPGLPPVERSTAQTDYKPKSPFERKVDHPIDNTAVDSIVADLPKDTVIDFNQANELKMIGFKNNWTVDQMSSFILVTTGVSKWGSIPSNYYDKIKTKFSEKHS